jgi:hypothetical protein
VLHPAQPVGRGGSHPRLIITEKLHQSLCGGSIGYGTKQIRGGNPNANILGARMAKRGRPKTRLGQRLGDAKAGFRRTAGVVLEKGTEWSGNETAHSKKSILNRKARLCSRIREECQHRRDNLH